MTSKTDSNARQRPRKEAQKTIQERVVLKKNKKIKILRRGRVRCRLRLRGGLEVWYAIILNNTRKCNSEVLFSHFIAPNIYFIIFSYKRAENAKKRPFVICIIASVSLRAGRRAFGTAEKHTSCILFAHAKKYIHIFSHCPLPCYSLCTPKSTKKRPNLSAGRGRYCWQYQLFFIANCLLHVCTFCEFSRVICKPVDI